MGWLLKANILANESINLTKLSHQTHITMDMKNWHERYKAMKKGMKFTNADIAEITGNTPDSIKTNTQNSNIPRWAKLAVVIYEKLTAYPVEKEFLGTIDDDIQATYGAK